MCSWYVLRWRGTMFIQWNHNEVCTVPTKCACFPKMKTPELLICWCQPQSVPHWCFIVASDLFHRVDIINPSLTMRCTSACCPVLSIIDVQTPGQLWTFSICFVALPAITAARVFTRYVASHTLDDTSENNTQALALFHPTTCNYFWWLRSQIPSRIM